MIDLGTLVWLDVAAVAFLGLGLSVGWATLRARAADGVAMRARRCSDPPRLRSTRGRCRIPPGLPDGPPVTDVRDATPAELRAATEIVGQACREADLPAGDLKMTLRTLIMLLAFLGGNAQAQQAPAIQASPALPAVDTPLSLTVSGGPGNSWDWVAISTAGSPFYSVLSWAYLPGAQSAASVPMPTPSGVGRYEARLYCCNGWELLASSTFEVRDALRGQDRIDAIFAPPKPVVPVPIGITFNPAAPKIPWDSPLGMPVSDIAVTMSDGSAFAGTLGFGAPDYNASGCFGIQASRVVVACQLPDAGGIIQITVTAAQ
jgi:hypothetical protein